MLGFQPVAVAPISALAAAVSGVVSTWVTEAPTAVTWAPGSVEYPTWTAETLGAGSVWTTETFPVGF